MLKVISALVQTLAVLLCHPDLAGSCLDLLRTLLSLMQAFHPIQERMPEISQPVISSALPVLQALSCASEFSNDVQASHEADRILCCCRHARE